MIDNIHVIVILNGIYDIACSLSILGIIDSPFLSTIHLNLFILETNQLFKRCLAYWIFTYGIIRMTNSSKLIPYSYYIEALFFANEILNGTVYILPTLFVVVTSIFIGIWYHIEDLELFVE